MADGADDRRLAGSDGASHGFFVEAPEVFQRAAAAGQDQRVEAATVGQLQGADDLLDGFAALHGGGDQGQLDLRRTAAEHTDDVADHCASGRADDADALRVSGQGAFVLGTEQAFGTEFFFQRFEGQAQGSVAGRLDGVEDQLIVATALEQRDLAAHFDRQAITQGLADPRGVLPKQRTAHLGAAVLEGEVDVTGGRAGEVGDLAFDPDIAEHVFQQHPGAAVELADGQDFAVQAESFEGVFDHGLHHKGLWCRGGSGSALSSSLARPAPMFRTNCSTSAPASRR
uniref:Uncharacterized protein n=1 Tax=Pseudomonas fluorescens TaxID=294 RepID=A0A5E6WF10_PSEFL|nr:hypothetical protein PS652_04666 [Pseudomonas fluorescens]